MAGNLLVALDEVREALRSEEGSEDDFELAADRFLRLLHSLLSDPLPLDKWDPRPALAAVELQLANDPDLDPDTSRDLFAAAKTIRDALDDAGRLQSSLN